MVFLAIVAFLPQLRFTFLQILVYCTVNVYLQIHWGEKTALCQEAMSFKMHLYVAFLNWQLSKEDGWRGRTSEGKISWEGQSSASDVLWQQPASYSGELWSCTML